jgi:S1-C subfamily serine protease
VADTLAARLHYPKGAIINLVLPGSTAKQLRVQKDDLIVRLNNMAIDVPNQILQALNKLRTGDGPVPKPMPLWRPTQMVTANLILFLAIMDKP